MKNDQHYILSIIVVVRNGETEISRTLESIREYATKEIQILVIDGDSTDKTMEIVQAYGDLIDIIVSEPDKGIYDGYNKGKALASGDFILYMNCGDRFSVENEVKDITSKLLNSDELYYSRAMILGNSVNFYYPPIRRLDNDWYKKNLPNMQTIFFPRTFYESYDFNLKLRLTADEDYKLHAIKTLKVNFIDTTLVDFKRDGISSNHKDFGLLLERIWESTLINREHKRYGRFFLDPFKRILTYFIHSTFGDDALVSFIKFIKK